MVPVPTGRNSFLSCANRNSSEIKVIFGLILLLAADQVQVVKSQTVNEPVNVNWVISLPWDVSNTLRAPFGGPVSLLLSVTAAAALLLGLLLAPVNYILGFPPRIYHTYRVPGILGKLPLIKSGRSFNSAVGGGEDSGENYSHYQHYYHHPTNITNGQFQFYDDGDGDGESFDMADILVHLFERVSSTFKIVFDKDSDYDFGEENFTGRELSVVKADEEESYGPPGFLDSIFLLVPEEDEICRQLMVCHAHGFLDFLPTSMVKLYKVLRYHIPITCYLSQYYH